MKTTILETTKESGTKNSSEESESEAKAKGKAGTKEESKCEAEEAQHKAKETFEEESCKTETKSTKAREEVRRLEAKSSLVCAMLDKNFPFQVNVFLRKHFYKYYSRKFKKGVGGKILKYGGNKKNHIFTIHSIFLSGPQILDISSHRIFFVSFRQKVIGSCFWVNF